MTARQRTFLSMTEAAHDLLMRCDKPGDYASAVLLRNWAEWRAALRRVEEHGLSHADILGECQRLNGCWLAAEVGPSRMAAELTLLSWEYWHGNSELRAILAQAAPRKKREPRSGGGGRP